MTFLFSLMILVPSLKFIVMYVCKWVIPQLIPLHDTVTVGLFGSQPSEVKGILHYASVLIHSIPLQAQAGLVIAPLSRRIFELENRLREAEELVRRQKVLNRKTEEVPVTQNVENVRGVPSLSVWNVFRTCNWASNFCMYLFLQLCEKYRDDIKQAGELSFQLEMKLNKVLKELEEKKAEVINNFHPRLVYGKTVQNRVR